MKLIYTADIHLKLGQKNVPVEWAKNRFYALFDCIYKACSNHDLLVVGGDVFDKVPSMEELELYFDFVRQIPIKCIIYPGNHEATKKTETFFKHIANATKWVNDKVIVITEYASIEQLDFIPYNRLKQFEEKKDFIPSNRILCTHVRGSIPPHVKPEVDLDIFDDWELVLAGDLHSHSNSQGNILYPGSPITTSFHRSEVDTGLLSVNTDTLTYSFLPLDLPQLLRVTVSSQEEVKPTSYHHTIYEVEGNMVDLAKVTDSELITKKLTDRVKDTALILDPSMSLVDEVRDYLQFVLNISSEEDIEQMLKEVHEFTTKYSSNSV